MSYRQLEPLTDQELEEQKRVRARRLPAGLIVGPLDLNRIIPVEESSDELSEGRKRRMEKKRNSFKAKFPDQTPPQDRSYSDHLHLIAALLNDGLGKDEPFTLNEIEGLIKHYSTTASRLHSLMSSALSAEREIDRGPEFDRRRGSRGRIIKWDYEQLEPLKGIAYYQRSYRGWWRSRDGVWVNFAGPSLPISQIEFLRYRFNEIRAGIFQDISVIQLPSHRDEKV